MFVIRMDSIHREYIATSYPNWLNLLNDITNKKQYATKFHTKKDAEEFLDNTQKFRLSQSILKCVQRSKGA